MLGQGRKSWLGRKTGLDVAQAIRVLWEYEVMVRSPETGCQHYEVDPVTFAATPLGEPGSQCRYTSCRDFERERTAHRA